MTYWQKQGKAPLFADLDFGRPEQRALGGTITIIGGNSSGFRAVASAATAAEQIGVGTLRILLPESLKKTIPPAATNIVFAPAESSGGFARAAEPVLLSAAREADAVLLAGDLGRNAETTAVLASVVKNTTQPIVITRDAIDLIMQESPTWIGRPALSLLATLPQLQKLFRTIYYPRVITLSQPLNQLVETLHKATITYPELVVATIHSAQYVVARGGRVVTTPLADTGYTPLSVVAGGDLAARVAVFQMRQPGYSMEAAATAVLAK